MLTRLKVRGFKNLLDADVSFGPFTCIAGANGIGKSNLFDAISFLRLLASEPLVEAALSIRDESGKSGDIRSLFFHHGDDYADTMRFEAEMLTSKDGVDELGQAASATSTFLRYTLELRYRGEDSEFGPLEIIEEELAHITKGRAPEHLLFGHSKDWLESVIVAKRKSSKPFISTAGQGADRVVRVHQDRTQGRPLPNSAPRLPRTVLSSVNASENPTAVVARSDMMGWKLLQLEPTALRQSDSIRAPRSIAASGAHMPATLHHLAKHDHDTPDIHQTIANRVAELVEDIIEIWVDEDHKRELLTLHARMRDGTGHPARSLSDGTLRFLALAIIEQSAASGGLFCLEEPENGIHPVRIPAILRLLQDISTDPQYPLDESNPLRQVIINTHSPVVVSEVDEDSLVIAEPARRRWRSQDISTVRFSALPETWRTVNETHMGTCRRGRLLSYLNPVLPSTEDDGRPGKRKRVVDREDVQMLLPLSGSRSGSRSGSKSGSGSGSESGTRSGSESGAESGA